MAVIDFLAPFIEVRFPRLGAQSSLQNSQHERTLNQFGETFLSNSSVALQSWSTPTQSPQYRRLVGYIGISKLPFPTSSFLYRLFFFSKIGG